MKLSLLVLLREPSFRFTSCIFEARELFRLPSLEVDEPFRELEESRRTEPLEQTTSSEKETLDVLPEPADDDDCRGAQQGRQPDSHWSRWHSLQHLISQVEE